MKFTKNQPLVRYSGWKARPNRPLLAAHRDLAAEVQKRSGLDGPVPRNPDAPGGAFEDEQPQWIARRMSHEDRLAEAAGPPPRWSGRSGTPTRRPAGRSAATRGRWVRGSAWGDLRRSGSGGQPGLPGGPSPGPYTASAGCRSRRSSVDPSLAESGAAPRTGPGHRNAEQPFRPAALRTPSYALATRRAASPPIVTRELD